MTQGVRSRSERLRDVVNLLLGTEPENRWWFIVLWTVSIGGLLFVCGGLLLMARQ